MRQFGCCSTVKQEEEIVHSVRQYIRFKLEVFHPEVFVQTEVLKVSQTQQSKI